MRYLSIDIETSGLDRDLHKVLSIGAIFEDTEKKLPYEEVPKFHAAVLQREITGSPFAINLNAQLISWISAYHECSSKKEGNAEKRAAVEKESGMKFYYEEEVVEAFYKFLCSCELVEQVGNEYMGNPNFLIIDGKTYPPVMSKMTPVHINCAGKNFGTFDKVFLEKLPRWQQAIRIRQRIFDPSILFVDWKNDTEMPNLLKCKQRAGREGIVTHNAIEDAWDVVELLRTQY